MRDVCDRLWKQMQMVNEKNMSYCLTAYLMMPVASVWILSTD